MTRKIVAREFVSLDGVIEAPEELTSRYGGPEFMEFLGAGMAESDALLLGRVTYEEQIPFWADRTEDCGREGGASFRLPSAAEGQLPDGFALPGA